jgi:hypothetical protein
MIIKCPNCNEEISSKAFRCVHCGAEFTHYCEECKAPLKEEDTVCSNCGCPVYSENNYQKKSKIGLAVTIIGLIVLIGVGMLGYFTYAKYSIKKQFLSSFYEVVPIMVTSSAEVEEVGIKIDSVWRNSIIDNTTKAMSNIYSGNWNLSDIQDSVAGDLSKLNNDVEYITKVDKINKDQVQIMKIMRDIKKPNEEQMDMYNDLKKFYDDYLNFSNTVLYTTGKSLDSFGEDFKRYQKEIMNDTLKLKQYIAN